MPSDSPFVNQFFHLLYGRKPDPGPVVDFVIERIWETDQGVMARRLAQLESFDISEELWRIDVPTLVLAGARDVIVPTARQRMPWPIDRGGPIPGDRGLGSHRVPDPPIAGRPRVRPPSRRVLRRWCEGRTESDSCGTA